MIVERLIVKGYKLLEDLDINLNQDLNIFVGENDSGKSSVLEALQIATRGRLNRITIDNLISPNIFSKRNRDTYLDAICDGKDSLLPEIVIEVYFSDPEKKYSLLRGTNNSLLRDYPGIRVKIEFDETYSGIYQAMMKEKQISEIPVEYYKVSKNYFSGEPINYRMPLFRVELLDTYQHDYSYTADRYIASVLDSYLSEEEKVIIKASYNQALSDFRKDDAVKKIIGGIKLASLEATKIGNTEVQPRNDVLQSISDKLEIIHEYIPLSFAGTGTQNLVQAALYLDTKNNVQALLIEEPENNLSFSNLHKLIQIIRAGKRQVFITTHSSYITNHLGLTKVFLINKGKAKSFSDLNNEDAVFFQKLSGYDTLRFVLSSKVILAEGPSDELILSRAYTDYYGNNPQDDGIDIISVNGLVFKRYCAIARKLQKKVVIVTDNDGKIDKLKTRYKSILADCLFSVFYDDEEKNYSLEPSIVEANCKTSEEFEKLVSIISPGKRMGKEELIKYMQDNKTEWAMKIFESQTTIKYPKHIIDAVQWWSKTDGQ